MSPISQFVMGLSIPWVGTKMILSSRRYFLLSLIPFFIGVLFVFLGFFLASEYLTPFLESWLSLTEYRESSMIWIKILSSFIFLIYWLVVGLFNFFFGYLCVLIVASPFYALLVEAIFQSENESRVSQASIGTAVKMILIGLLKVILFATIGVFCFIFSFIPGLNLLVPVVIYSLVAFDCVDYAFEVHLLTLKQRFRFFLNNIMVFMGLGVSIFLSSLLPGAFFVLLPIFICGATKIYIQLSLKAV